MNFSQSVKSVYSRYVLFSGRAGRPEYWYFALFSFIVQIAIAMVSIASENASNILMAIFILGSLLPSIGVGVRRLHDTDRSGWWMLIGIIPLIGTIVLIVFFCLRGTEGPNRFGEGPMPPVA